MRCCLTCHGRFEPRRLICPVDKDMLVDEGTPAQETGQIVAGKYRLGNLLGEGGMGKVYEATCLTPGEETAVGKALPSGAVAIKLLKLQRLQTDKERQTAERRFLMEAQAAASLESPGIVHALDYGKLPDGTSYMALERLYGATFDELRRAGKFAAIERVIELVREVCGILQIAHSRSIVHRDLKPSNLFLHRLDRDRSQVKILDFGIAKFLDRLADQLTTPGEFVGTLLYMAPEQASGQTVSYALDVYALGVILFEALAGRPPFTARNPLEFLKLHASSPAPALRSLRPDVSPELEEVVARCLRKKPEHRYANAGELAAALAAIRELRATDESLAHTAVVHVGASDLVGTVLDERYELQEWVSRGRFGSDVYRAIHLRTDADVALRLWRVGLGPARDCLLDAFRREARAMRVRHPSVLTILDMGYTDDCVYLVTDLVKSLSLRQVMNREGPLAYKVVHDLVRGVAEALEALHQEGIVSGGLSPETIRVVSGPRGFERMLISPLGLKDPGQLAALFQHFGSMDIDDRSWEYISPEQKGGREPDGRSDVYSLAAIAVEMLGGSCEGPLRGATTTRTETARPDAAGATGPLWTLPKELRPDVRGVLEKALSGDPAARILSARAFLEALPKP